MWVRAIAAASLVALVCSCHEPQEPITAALVEYATSGASDEMDIRHLVPSAGEAVERTLKSYGYAPLQLIGPRPPGFEDFPMALSESFADVPLTDGTIRRIGFQRRLQRGDAQDVYGVFVDLGEGDAVLQARGARLFSTIF